MVTERLHSGGEKVFEIKDSDRKKWEEEPHPTKEGVKKGIKEYHQRLKREKLEKNRRWSYIYIAIGFSFILAGIYYNEQYLLYIFSIIMFLLAGFRLFILDKKLS